MPDLTRRQLLGKSLGAATAGAALVGGAAVVPRLLAGSGQASRPSDESVANTLVVHVRPGASGDMRVISGDRSVVINDAQMVSRLRSASSA